MDYYTIYIYVIFLIKIVFFILASTHLYLKIKNQNGSNLDKEILFWRERTEFIFILLMAILLIFLFNPYKNKMYMINNEVKSKFLVGSLPFVRSSYILNQVFFVLINNLI